jgi:hypothetical protein
VPSSGGVGGAPDAGSSGAAGDGGGELCGNGTVDPGEKCDRRIGSGQPGACPSANCGAATACNPRWRQGTGCQAECVSGTITEPDDGKDGCCPTGATPATDRDCSEETCGDGQVTGNEKCDTALATGSGACPDAMSCLTSNACEPKQLAGTGCSVECVMSEISQPLDGDGCCPAGANANVDDDCSASCNNGVVEPGETCEASCPATCPSIDVCQPRELTGNVTECTAACINAAPITACTSDDGCCPIACTNTGEDGSDLDCPLTSLCHDGQLDPGEFCDDGSGSPTPCPMSCTAVDACRPQVLSGSAVGCTARCIDDPITQIGPIDGCCPSEGNAGNDLDCAAVCGNGVLEPGEKCESNCPTSCMPLDACNPRTLNGSDCQRQCLVHPITEAGPNDGCCPSGANANTDPNCSPQCGNGVLEAGEDCEPSGLSDLNCRQDCTSPVNECLVQAAARGEPIGAGTCANCLCPIPTCRDAINACYLATDRAAAGPRVGAERSVLCAELIECVRTTDCTTTIGNNHCLCGDATEFTCALAGGGGPCDTEIMAAAETTDIAQVPGRQTDTSYAFGRAGAVASCANANCPGLCL